MSILPIYSRGFLSKIRVEKGLKGNHWNELSDIPQLYSSYGVRGIPYYVLIDPDGNVKEHWSGYGKGSLRKRLGELIEP
ncbi:MAG: hypothetical protein SNG02_08320 [Rikenellaceae bacterium]